MIIGAPYDAGTAYRAGTRFGPKMIRTTDYLPHDSSRPHLTLRVDPLQELRAVDAGDVEMAGVEGRLPLDTLENAVRVVTEAGAIPIVLGGDHTITWPDVTGVARQGLGPRVCHPLRRSRRHQLHPVRQPGRPWAAHAAPDRIRRVPRRSLPADRAPRLLAGTSHIAVDGRAKDAVVRDARSRAPRPGCGARGGLCQRDRRLRRRLRLGRPRRCGPGHGAWDRYTGTGRTGRQLLDAVRRIAIELPVVGVDAVEVSPPYDAAEITSFLANRVVLEMLAGIAYRRKGGTWDTIPPTLLEGRT